MATPFPNAPHQIRGKLHCLNHESVVLQENLWGDPSNRDVWVYTPNGYEHQKEQKYPILIFLPSYGSTGESMFARGLTNISMTTRLDKILSAEKLGCIAVFPDVMTSLVGTQFLNSPSIGNYGSYIMEEILPFVQQQFNHNGKVGVLGHSSGGYGAVRLAMDFPHLIDAVSCQAGDMGFSTGYCGDLSLSIGPIRKAGSPMNYIHEYWKKSHFSHSEWAAMNILCMSAAYSPWTQKEIDVWKLNKGQYKQKHNQQFPAHIPVDFERGIIDFELFLSWEQHDPIVLIDNPQNQNSLSELDLLFLDAGAYDEYHLQLGARRFVQKLKDYDVQHEYEEFEGGHRGTSYRFDTTIPQIIKALVL